jgi:hypothetical protein
MSLSKLKFKPISFKTMKFTIEKDVPYFYPVLGFGIAEWGNGAPH